jgi:peptidoglycan/LPS O-acetylase OafA/YrhL
VLRFFAFLVVFGYHLGGNLHSHLSSETLDRFVDDISGAGACGVDLFFLLSAYLITELLLREKEQSGSLNLKAFYVRRIARIWPLYFFFIALAFSIQWILPGQHLATSYIAGYVLLVGNWVVAFHGMPASIAVPLWSVSIEEQFYLLWPCIARRIGPRQMTYVASGLLLVCSVIRLLLLSWHVRPGILDFGTFTRIDAIAAGVLIAAMLKHRAPTLSAVTRLSLFMGGGLAWVQIHHFRFPPAGSPYPFLPNLIAYPCIAAASSAIFIAVLGSRLKHPVLLYLGQISYGLYIYHFMSIEIVHHLLYPRTKHVAGFAAYVLLSAIVTLALASASYAWLERPFLRLKQRFAVVPSRPV